MKHLKNLLVLLLISSCASVPNVPVCRQRAVNQGFCTWTIKNKSQIVDDTHPLILDSGVAKTWLDLKIESVYIPAESYSVIKEYILKQCKKHNDCDKEVTDWAGKVESINPVQLY